MSTEPGRQQKDARIYVERGHHALLAVASIEAMTDGSLLLRRQ